MEFVTGLVSAQAGPAVRVQRNGNSKVLPVPAELARRFDVDLGEIYVVEVIGDDFIYHRRDAHSVAIHDSGSDRYGVIAENDIMPVPQRASVPPLDWDF